MVHVTQITGAMENLNLSTQQNASAAEELSATAEELSAQATELQGLMAYFKLRGDESEGAAPRREKTSARVKASDAVSRMASTPHRQTTLMAQPHGGHGSDVDESHFAHF